MKRYKNDYIGEIVAAIESKPAYQKLRLVAVIEPDSLPNLVTNLDGSYPNCNEAEPYYREGVRYAVSELSSLTNVYLYLDIAHSGWLGWEHTQAAANLYRQILSDGGNLMDAIQGFATNVANYSALEETFNPYNNQQEYQDLIENFYEWNRIIDEVAYVEELRKQFSNKGFIIDTSRNGWTPRGEGLPLDSRVHRGNWCNQKNAGLGERPMADPREGVHAYFWIKPPGESDGTSNPDEGEDPDNPTTQGKRFDPMCGTDSVKRPYSDEGVATGALAGAPHAGMWFHEQFLMLVENATPAL
jgi:cellulose 1,4-beta-cellobiosidase